MKVITLGTFDILHAGHIKLLKFCKELGETIVGLNTDEFVARYKGKPPIMTYDERKLVLEEFGVRVIPNDQVSRGILPILEAERPNLIVVGSDWAVKDYVGQIGVTWRELEELGIGICYFPRSLNMSTSLIKERVKNG
jgi:cytidyltransferase-like protein